MNRMQKTAFFILVVFGTAIITTATAVGIAYYIVGWPKASGGIGFMGICGIAGLAPLIFKKDPGKVTCDERDVAINSKSATAGFTTAFLVTGLACMLPFFILGPKTTIPVVWLPNIFAAAGLSSFTVHSIVILVMYGRNSDDQE